MARTPAALGWAASLIKSFAHGVGIDENEYTMHIGQSLLVSSVARVFTPGCKVDEMVVLEGGQGLGKSTCIAELFGFDWYLETSEPPTTKDFYVTMQGHTVVEIGEMQSFSKADINQVKMAITRRDDKYRAPYERHGESHPRQCVFIGTTNADTLPQRSNRSSTFSAGARLQGRC